MQQIEFHVSDMSCRACDERIEKALVRVEGVVRSAAYHRAGQVRVVFDPTRTSEQAVRSRIEQAGYKVSR